MSEAMFTCKTCGGTNGSHRASEFDPLGIGNPVHAGERAFYIDSLLNKYESKKARGYYDLGTRKHLNYPSYFCNICAKPAIILSLGSMGERDHWLCENHYLTYENLSGSKGLW